VKPPKALESAWTAVGGLSAPGKMPCASWSVPAAECDTGSKLRKVAGSVCSVCYAQKGRYGFPNVQDALYRRLGAWKADRSAWRRGMTELIHHHARNGYWRWFDSGDLQGLPMLRDIAAVARATPQVRHWLPTKEIALVGRWLVSGATAPANLVIRASATMLDQDPAPFAELTGYASGSVASGATCPAPDQGGKCLDCRRCWHDKLVTYRKH